MRLDHLLSKEEEVGVVLLFSIQKALDKERMLWLNKQAVWGQKREYRELLVAMRIGETPVPIPNTMVKTYAADDTTLETVWESRWLPD